MPEPYRARLASRGSVDRFSLDPEVTQDYSFGVGISAKHRLAILVAVFAGLTLLVGTGATDAADDAILGLVLPWRSPLLDQVFQLITFAGDPLLSSILAVAITLVAVAHEGRRGQVVLLFFAGIAVEYALKQLVFQPGPPSELVRDAVLIPGLGHLSPYTFPGGHVMRVTFLALMIGASYPRLRIAGFVVVALVAAGRIYLATGWAADIAGGLIVGLALATVAEIVHERLGSPQRKVTALAT